MNAPEPNEERTHAVNPISNALNDLLSRKAARPQDVYRLAVIVEGLLDSLDNPEALQTIRTELRELINDMAQSIPGSN